MTFTRLDKFTSGDLSTFCPETELAGYLRKFCTYQTVLTIFTRCRRTVVYQPSNYEKAEDSHIRPSVAISSDCLCKCLVVKLQCIFYCIDVSQTIEIVY